MNMDRLDMPMVSPLERDVPQSRREAGRKALTLAFRNLFSDRNPVRKFRDAYRFNVIRWSASNLRAPSWGKRIALFFGTKNPVSILRDDYRMNRGNLINKWEAGAINRINVELARLGRTSLNTKERGTFKSLQAVEKQVRRLEGYAGCPDMRNEKLLLDTYKYILSSPFDKRSGNLNPDDLCGLLQQNGVSSSSLPYQNYESILQGRETVLYEPADGINGKKYLQPTDRVKLNTTPNGYSMELSGYFPKQDPAPVSNTADEIQPSLKREKQEKQQPVSQKAGKVEQPTPKRKSKTTGMKIK